MTFMNGIMIFFVCMMFMVLSVNHLTNGQTSYGPFPPGAAPAGQAFSDNNGNVQPLVGATVWYSGSQNVICNVSFIYWDTVTRNRIHGPFRSLGPPTSNCDQTESHDLRGIMRASLFDYFFTGSLWFNPQSQGQVQDLAVMRFQSFCGFNLTFGNNALLNNGASPQTSLPQYEIVPSPGSAPNPAFTLWGTSGVAILDTTISPPISAIGQLSFQAGNPPVKPICP